MALIRPFSYNVTGNYCTDPPAFRCCNAAARPDCMLATKEEQNTTLLLLLRMPVCHLLQCVT